MNQELFEEEKQAAKRGWIKLALVIFFIVLVAFIRDNVMNFSIVFGTSMEETLHEGDVLLVNTGKENIERYDIITMRVGEVRLIKRVIGLPGEAVQIIGGKIHIDGKEIVEQHAGLTDYGGVAEEVYCLGEDEYFVMGDNRAESVDSRSFGSINAEDVIGEVVFVIHPFNKEFR